jgi:hypothetical protein
MTLLTKIQFNNFETGEFTEEKERTLDETIAIINAFPWDQQREHFSVGLTGASITIQGPNDDFLKLALYYHEKFVLYYCKGPKSLYTKSFAQYPDAFPIIQSFFDDAEFDTTSFRHETTWFQHPATKFQTRSFIYDLNPARLVVTATPLLFIFIYTLVFTLGGIFGRPSARPPLTVLALIFWCVFFAIAWLFLNHFKTSKGHVLILSKGKDEFAYGPAAAPIWRNKLDIAELITHGRRGRGGYSATTRVEIIFKNNASFNISCLFISWDDLMQKFPGYPTSVKGETFPFMPPDASAPS